jgi:hypothetical protein
MEAAGREGGAEHSGRPDGEACVHIPVTLGAEPPAGKRSGGLGCWGLPIWRESDDRPRGMRVTCQVLRVCSYWHTRFKRWLPGISRQGGDMKTLQRHCMRV